MVIVDYGMGNLHSVLKAFHRIGAEVKVSSEKSEIEKADKLILPGVGHFRNGMARLSELGFVEVLGRAVLERKVPILGICLGIQLFTRYSEEGDVDGLGWVDAQTVRFDFSGLGRKLTIPHMGWNNLHLKKKCPLLEGVGDYQFYFVHSYHLKCADNELSVAETDYGFRFTSVIRKGNIYGTQFHPEKSHKGGLRILRNFLEHA